MESKLRKRELKEQQVNLRDFLLQKLGFTKNELKDKYAILLTQFYLDKDFTKEFTYKDKITEKEVTVPVHYNVIDALFDEVKFREEKKWLLKNNHFASKAISATELSAFDFCPASFSIFNTFETDTTKAMEIGTEQHEESILSAFKKDYYKNFTESSKQVIGSTEQPEYINEENNYLFEDIQNSTLVFSGHKENSNQLFFNNKKDFVGQPDYIFKNNKGDNFIVEEKFKQNDNITSSLFSNHKVQLISYLYGLEEIDAKYGYLVYWYYCYENYSIKIQRCKVFKVTKSETAKEYLVEIFDKTNVLKSGKKIVFDVSKLSPNKCVNCSFNKWCGHKTGLFKELYFPYQNRYLNTYVTKYNVENSASQIYKPILKINNILELEVEANWKCLEHSGLDEINFLKKLNKDESFDLEIKLSLIDQSTCRKDSLIEDTNKLKTNSDEISTELTKVTLETFLKAEGLSSYEKKIKISFDGVPYISFFNIGIEKDENCIDNSKVLNLHFTSYASNRLTELGYVAGHNSEKKEIDLSKIEESFFTEFKVALAFKPSTGELVWMISHCQE